jgi:hypothetical protein
MLLGFGCCARAFIRRAKDREYKLSGAMLEQAFTEGTSALGNRINAPRCKDREAAAVFKVPAQHRDKLTEPFVVRRISAQSFCKFFDRLPHGLVRFVRAL